MITAPTTILHLSLLDGIGPAAIKKIVAGFSTDSSLLDLYTMDMRELMHRCHLSEQTAEIIVTGLRDVTLLEKELSLIEKHNVQWTTILDTDVYPPLLNEIHMPPPVLYWWGNNLAVTKNSIGCVGSRAANQYGNRIINTLIPPLVAAHCTIISGGALGADSMAHKATLQAGGITVAVLGSGLLRPYPQSNEKLFKEIVAKNGILLSIFPLLEEAGPGNFPARNRIIAGLSRGCIVIQAAEKSGALITAEYALEQGREVFAVPGAFDDPLSAGCHKLLRRGAQLVTCADHILQELGYAQKAEIPDNPDIHNQQKIVPIEPTQTIQTKSIVVNDLSDASNTVLKACTQQACSLDELVTLLNADYITVQSTLFDLQYKGFIEQDFTGKWISKI
jgi:DNA processing protein